MKARKLVPLAVLLVLVESLISADEPAQEKNPSYWMKKKLEYSEKVMGGLVNRDFVVIAKTARTMNTLSHMEKWARSNQPEYRAQLQLFENANEQLVRAADRENLDGAALAYVQLTLSCVNCHKVVRDLVRPEPVAK